MKKKGIKKIGNFKTAIANELIKMRGRKKNEMSINYCRFSVNEVSGNLFCKFFKIICIGPLKKVQTVI